jgi:hypothetical protein
MRISIQGQADAAKVIAGYLRSQGYLLTDQRPNYTVYLSERETPVIDGAPSIVIDGVDCPLEARIIYHLSHLTKARIVLARAGGIQSDREIHIEYSPEETLAVERGVFRGVLDVVAPQKARSWWKRVLKRGGQYD